MATEPNPSAAAGATAATHPPVRIGLIGCGGIAQAYMQASGRVADLTIAAVCEPDPDRRTAAAENLGATPHHSLEEMLASEDLEAALVATPPSTHEEITTRLLGSGLHVLCEKPLAPTPSAAERMLGAAADAGRVLMMGSKFRYVGDMAAARSLLDEELIGDVLLFENAFCSRVDMTQRWNSDPAISGGGVLIDNGCHSVDIARYLLGPIARVQAWVGKQSQPIAVEDTARMLFESSSGALGTIDLSWSLHKEVASYVRLYGTGGTMEIGWKRSRYKLEGDTAWTDFGKGYDKLEAFGSQLTNFARTVRGAEPPVINASDALASVRVIDAAYRSAREHHWFEVT